jgi:hypothetical protein
MSKYAEQYRELPQGKHAQNSEDRGNEDLSLEGSRIVDGSPMECTNQSHFGHLNHDLPRLNTNEAPPQTDEWYG